MSSTSSASPASSGMTRRHLIAEQGNLLRICLKFADVEPQLSALAGLQDCDAVHCAAQKRIKNARFMMVEKLTDTDAQPDYKQLCVATWPGSGTGNSGGDCLLKIHA